MLDRVSSSQADAILVIDDEAPIRHAIASALRPFCERVLEAGSGAEGVELAATARPDRKSVV